MKYDSEACDDCAQLPVPCRPSTRRYCPFLRPRWAVPAIRPGRVPNPQMGSPTRLAVGDTWLRYRDSDRGCGRAAASRSRAVLRPAIDLLAVFSVDAKAAMSTRLCLQKSIVHLNRG